MPSADRGATIEEIERRARHAFAHDDDGPTDAATWNELPEAERDRYRAEARAAHDAALKERPADGRHWTLRLWDGVWTVVAFGSSGPVDYDSTTVDVVPVAAAQAASLATPPDQERPAEDARVTVGLSRIGPHGPQRRAPRISDDRELEAVNEAYRVMCDETRLPDDFAAAQSMAMAAIQGFARVEAEAAATPPDPVAPDEAALQRAASDAVIAEEGNCTVCGDLTRQKAGGEYLCPTHLLAFKQYLADKAEAVRSAEQGKDQSNDRNVLSSAERSETSEREAGP